MEPNVMAASGLRLLLADLITAAEGELAGAKAKLFTNDVDPGKPALIGDFTLATFTGSAPIAIPAWGEVHTDTDGNASTASPLLQWDYDSGTAETVFGVVITNAADVLIGYARLESQKVMDDTADSLALVLKVTIGGDGFGAGVRAV